MLQPVEHNLLFNSASPGRTSFCKRCCRLDLAHNQITSMTALTTSEAGTIRWSVCRSVPKIIQHHSATTSRFMTDYFKPILLYMGVSINGGTSKSSILVGFSHMNHQFLGTPIYGNPHIYVFVGRDGFAQTLDIVVNS